MLSFGMLAFCLVCILPGGLWVWMDLGLGWVVLGLGWLRAWLIWTGLTFFLGLLTFAESQ